LDTIGNEAAFRALNDRIKELESDWHSADPMAFVCECSSAGCTAAVYLTIEEYGAIRAHSDHFLMLPHHVVLDSERIVRSNDRYAVVAKLDADDPLEPPTNWT